MPYLAEGKIREYSDGSIVVAIDDAFVEQEELSAAQAARVWIFGLSDDL